MSSYCIPKHIADAVKKDLQGNIDNLYRMTDDERVKFFRKHDDTVNKRASEKLTREFESAMLSNQKDAIKKWADKSLTGNRQGVELDDIFEADEIISEKSDILIESIADKAMGINVSAKEAEVIHKMTDDLMKLKLDVGDDFGVPLSRDRNNAFAKKAQELESYLAKITPGNFTQTLTSTIGRGNLLFNIKSPLLNIESNGIVGIAELIRKYATYGLGGTDSKLVKNYISHAVELKAKHNVDVTRILGGEKKSALADELIGSTLGERTNRVTGDDATAKTGRFFEDAVFKYGLGVPDVAFSAAQFATTADKLAYKMAGKNKSEAREFLIDAMRVDPKTWQGEAIRQQSVADAMYATFQNKSKFSEKLLELREVMNSENFKFGDLAVPFVKTPANVISLGADYSGVGALRAVKALYSIGRTGGTRDDFREAVSGVVRTGIGLTGAMALASQFEDADFVGAYEPARLTIDGLQNNNYNAVKINGNWISLDYFGPLAAPFTAIMYAKKYGDDDPKKQLKEYSIGVGSQILRAPGIETVRDTITDMTDFFDPESSTREYIAEKQVKNFSKFISSRLVPGLSTSIVSDFAKGLDNVQRDVSVEADNYTDVFLGTLGNQFKKQIPGLRETLPEKKNIFGETMQEENLSTSILFGGRVKENIDKPLNNEIVRLRNAGVNLGLKDLDFKQGNVAKYRASVSGEEFNKFEQSYGEELKKEYEKVITKDRYKNKNDDEKAKILNGINNDVIKKQLKKAGFKAPN